MQGRDSSGNMPAHFQQRQIRVFVSSTFRDMHAEREVLVKQVFPELRRICADRFVTFTEVDLRWGITGEQAAEGKVLPICLEEIHRSRPYFIGLLGERYGWIPETVPQKVVDREPWLKAHVNGQASVTELEILHGVLNNPVMAGHSFFYFRDPAYVETIPEKDRVDFIAENSADAEKLGLLKDRIRRSGFPVLENYTNPEILAEAVRGQFITLIDDLYPKEEVPDPLDREAMGHDAYGREKLTAYVPRPAHTAVLDAFINADPMSPGMVFTGDSGAGKTALLAAWIESRREAYPEDFVFAHYFGAAPDSTSVPGFLGRLLGELKRRYGITEDIPAEIDKLREALSLWLARTVGKGRIVLVLDALNQIEGDAPDRSLAWLPRHFPDHVRVIVSSLSGPALDALTERGWYEYRLPLADREERPRMIHAFFAHYRKTLSAGLGRQIAEAPGSANPLFLRTVLEELRQFGRFEQLPERVAHYLEAETPEALLRKVLHRWQEDFDNGRDLVQRTLSHLWAARQGLSETEWLELLGAEAQALPRQTWAPFFFAMEPHLTRRGGLYAFGHDFLRRAVQTEFLLSEEAGHTAHLSLADYFEHQDGMPPRKASEWPWQLQAAGAWDRLESCLTDKSLFLTVYNDRTKWELADYWRPLRARGISLGQRYVTAFDRWSRGDERNGHEIAYILGVFLRELACFSESKDFIYYALKGFEGTLGFDDPKTLSALDDLAILIDITGSSATAEKLSRQAMEGFERVWGANHPRTLKSMGQFATMLGDFLNPIEAERLALRAAEGLEKALGKNHLDTLKSKWGLANIKNDYHMLWEVAENLERVLGPDHPETLMIFANFIDKYQIEEAYGPAEIIARRCYEGFNRVLGPEHNLTFMVLTQLSELLVIKGDYAQAEPFVLRVIDGYYRLDAKSRPSVLEKMRSLAWKLYKKGDYDHAEPLYQYVFEGYEQVLGMRHRKTLSTAKNLAELLKKIGDNKQAEQVYHRVLECCEHEPVKVGPLLFDIFHNYALLRQDNGDYQQAEQFYRRALEGRERMLGKEHPNTLASANSLAGLLQVDGDTESAEPIKR